MRILALLHECNGARFAVMKRGLNTNADSLSRSLQFLMNAGWVQRNPGYGHPLRPEYVLTPQGRTVAPQCSRLVQMVDRLDVAEAVYRKWSVPLLVTIKAGTVRFSGLREALAINPRALTQSLQRLSTSELIVQRLEYGLTPSGKRIATLGQSLL